MNTTAEDTRLARLSELSRSAWRVTIGSVGLSVMVASYNWALFTEPFRWLTAIAAIAALSFPLWARRLAAATSRRPGDGRKLPRATRTLTAATVAFQGPLVACVFIACLVGR